MSKAPAVQVGFSQTPIFLRSQGSQPASQVEDDKGKEEAEDLSVKVPEDAELEVFEFPLKVEVDAVAEENPLLEESEKLSMQDANTIFLTGVLTGGFAVGLFFFVRWMLSPRQPSKEDLKMLLEQFLDD